jgi:hypothetical protein
VLSIGIDGIEPKPVAIMVRVRKEKLDYLKRMEPRASSLTSVTLMRAVSSTTPTPITVSGITVSTCA